jgi:hypothetical protein
MAGSDKIITWLMSSEIVGLRVLDGDIIQYLKRVRQKSNDFQRSFLQKRGKF